MKTAGKHVRKISLVLLILLTLPLLFPFRTAVSAAEAGKMTEVILSSDGKTLTVSAVIPEETVKEAGKRPFLLFALAPGERPEDAEPVAETAPSVSPTASVPCAGSELDLLFRGYLFALREEDGSYTVLTDRASVSNPHAASAPSSAPKPVSKKGLSVSEPLDAELLGAAHTVLPVRLNPLLSTAKVANTVSFSFAGKTYTVSGNYLEWLDGRIRVLSENGVRVYLRLLLEKPDADDPVSRSLLFDGVNGDEARFFGVSVSSAEASDLIAGTVRFLAKRYSGENREQGAVSDYIVGYEVNSNRFSHYSGAMDPDVYAAEYANYLRVVSTAVRSVISDGAVYVPIGSNWNEVSADYAVPADQKLDYSARAFLTALNAALAHTVPYRIALDAYASDVTKGDVWNDEAATDSPDTPFITMKNVGILLDEADRMPDVQPGLLISEFGVSGKLGDESEDTQVAAFLYAYGKAVSESRITALIWHAQVDSSGEKGLYFGLRAASVTDPDRPGDKKMLYSVFRDIDTPEQPDLTGWLSLLPEGSTSVFPVCRTVLNEVPADPSVTEKLPAVLLFDPEKEQSHGFFPAENAKWVTVEEDGTVSAALYPAWDYSCVTNASLTRDALGGAEYLSLTVSAVLPGSAENTAADFLLILTGTDRTGLPLRLECAARIESGGEQTVSFRVADFLKKAETVTSLKIGLRAPTDGKPEDEFSLRVRRLELLGKKSSFADRLLRVLIILALITGVGILVFLILWTVRRLSIRRRRKKKSAMKAGRKAERTE
ncbi:MAG: DUF5722 domain-containing protein [Lachnospiraceae bacterium]|nr:DUF5722 domain-containing protein [Lachnospiraceae bacterium]